MQGIKDRFAQVKKLVRTVVTEVYWRIGAFEEDRYASKYVAYAEVDKDQSNDLVVAQFQEIAHDRDMRVVEVCRGKPDAKEK